VAAQVWRAPRALRLEMGQPRRSRALRAARAQRQHYLAWNFRAIRVA